MALLRRVVVGCWGVVAIELLVLVLSCCEVTLIFSHDVVIMSHCGVVVESLW